VSDGENGTKKKRLFLAVNLSIASTRKIGETIAAMRRAAEGKLRAAWVPTANLHVTLKFLGWANPEAVEAIRDAVAHGTKSRKGFEIGARGVGAFPESGTPRVMWVGITDPSGALVKLANDVDRWMEKLGFAKETRAYHPHVTTARVKEVHQKGFVDELHAPYKTTDFGTSLVREVILYESSVTSKGSEYLGLARIPLDAPPYRAERQTRDVEGEDKDEEPETHGGHREGS
jgi:2'-5' RNA ligase